MCNIVQGMRKGTIDRKSQFYYALNGVKSLTRVSSRPSSLATPLTILAHCLIVSLCLSFFCDTRSGDHCCTVLERERDTACAVL